MHEIEYQTQSIFDRETEKVSIIVSIFGIVVIFSTARPSTVYLCVCAYLFILIKRGTCCCFCVFFLPRQHCAPEKLRLPMERQKLGQGRREVWSLLLFGGRGGNGLWQVQSRIVSMTTPKSFSKFKSLFGKRYSAGLRNLFENLETKLQIIENHF